MNPEKLMTDLAKTQAKTLGLSFGEAIKVARMARPITGYDWWTHQYEDFLVRKGDGKIHALGTVKAIPQKTGEVPRHLLISARDSIRDLLTAETPQAERENAEYVLREIEKELK